MVPGPSVLYIGWCAKYRDTTANELWRSVPDEIGITVVQ